MSRRSVPNIDPNDLRDHAIPDRVDRIWNRIEGDLQAQGLAKSGLAKSGLAKSGLAKRDLAKTNSDPVPNDELQDAMVGRELLASGEGRALRSSRPGLVGSHSKGRLRVWALLAAAAVFGGGFWVGHLGSHEPTERIAAVGSTRESAVDVFASGSQSRTFQLPNGGSILLEPESTLEVAEVADTGMTLRLLRGSASVDNTRAAGGSVAIVAGEARLSAPAGGIVAVRRNERDVDVIVSGGNVDLDAPGVHQHLSNGDRLHAVPISWPTTALDPAKHHAEVDAPATPMHVLRLAHDGHSDRVASDSPQAVTAQPSWFSEYQVGHDEAALKLLKQQGDMRSLIAGAHSGAELAALSDLNGGSELGIMAAKRAVDEFPQDPKVVGLPFSLSRYYENKGDEELARKYGALAGDRFSDDIDCRALRRGDPASAETAERARAYLAKYVSGSCRADAEALAGEGDLQKPDTQKGDASKRDSHDAQTSGNAKADGSAKPDAAGSASAAPGNSGPPSNSTPSGSSNPPGDSRRPPPEKTSEKADKTTKSSDGSKPSDKSDNKKSP